MPPEREKQRVRVDTGYREEIEKPQPENRSFSASLRSHGRVHPDTSPNKAPKILLVAEHASAQFGGEALIPFQYFKNLRELKVDVHLLVHERTRSELVSSFPQDIDRLHFVDDSLINM